MALDSGIHAGMTANFVIMRIAVTKDVFLSQISRYLCFFVLDLRGFKNIAGLANITYFE